MESVLVSGLESPPEEPSPEFNDAPTRFARARIMTFPSPHHSTKGGAARETLCGPLCR